MTNREIALEATATGLGRLAKLQLGTLSRYLEADLRTIQDAVTNIQELKRPRLKVTAKAPKTKARDDNPRAVAILGGDISL